VDLERPVQQRKSDTHRPPVSGLSSASVNFSARNAHNGIVRARPDALPVRRSRQPTDSLRVHH
jgi:hypothetical protein